MQEFFWKICYFRLVNNFSQCVNQNVELFSLLKVKRVCLSVSLFVCVYLSLSPFIYVSVIVYMCMCAHVCGCERVCVLCFEGEAWSIVR
jgi:hypothetical protein